MTRVPPAAALLLEFVRYKKQIYIRTYLYGDIDNLNGIKPLAFPLQYDHKDLLLTDKVSAFIANRLRSEGHLPDYLDIECQNMNFSLDHEFEAHRRLLDPTYTVRELLKFYNLSSSLSSDEDAPSSENNAT